MACVVSLIVSFDRNETTSRKPRQVLLILTFGLCCAIQIEWHRESERVRDILRRIQEIFNTNPSFCVAFKFGHSIVFYMCTTHIIHTVLLFLGPDNLQKTLCIMCVCMCMYDLGSYIIRIWDWPPTENESLEWPTKRCRFAHYVCLQTITTHYRLPLQHSSLYNF